MGKQLEPGTLSDSDAYDLISAIRNGEEPAYAWVKALALWAESKSERCEELEMRLAGKAA